MFDHAISKLDRVILTLEAMEDEGFGQNFEIAGSSQLLDHPSRHICSLCYI